MTDAVTTDTVEAGDHACLTFTDAEERLDLVAAFVRDGLRAGSKVVCWTDSGSPAGVRIAGQLTTATRTSWNRRWASRYGWTGTCT